MIIISYILRYSHIPIYFVKTATYAAAHNIIGSIYYYYNPRAVSPVTIFFRLFGNVNKKKDKTKNNGVLQRAYSIGGTMAERQPRPKG